MDLNLLPGFVAIARQGTLSAAARELGLSKATLSRQLAALEAELGVTLVDRSTRRQRLSPAGERLYHRVAPTLEEWRDLRDETIGQESGTRGSVRLTAPIEVGTQVLAPALAKFRAAYPDVDVEVRLADARLDLRDDGLDVALRAGPLVDSRLKAVRLGQGAFRLYASTDYLKRRGRPRKPADLREHELIAFSPRPGPAIWSLVGPAGKFRLELRDRLRVNNLDLARRFTHEGLGIACLPRFLCHDQVGLVETLEGWRGEAQNFSLVHKADRYPRPAVTALIEFLRKELRAATW